jgi:antitoxin CptB|tara:strand:+ start:37516 stop:37824 length:309 start_codon:yes stop_codon:yes gene_type:complete
LERLTLNDDNSPAAILRKRLYWHSRRGMWELDLLLIPFLEQRFDHLGEADQLAYQKLIEGEDQDLFVWLMHREWPEEPSQRRIVQMIVEHAETTDNSAYRTL